MNKYRALFIEESREHLAELSRLLAELEQQQSLRPHVDACFRHIHSVKGMAASMGFDPITALAHGLEDRIEEHRHSEQRVERDAVDLFLQVTDALLQQIDAVAQDTSPLARPDLVAALTADPAAARLMVSNDSSSGAMASSASTSSQGGRVVRTLDVTVTLDPDSAAPSVRGFLVHRTAGELVSIRDAKPSLETLRGGGFTGHSLALRVRGDVEVETLQSALGAIPDVVSVAVAPENPNPPQDDSTSAKRGSAPSTVRVRVDILDRLLDGMGELLIIREQLNSVVTTQNPAVRAALDGLETRMRDLHGQVLAVRMTPLQTLTDRYPRVVRDLCRTLGKDAELTIEGDKIELDRAILEALDTPFLHTLRNAVDHGIELPAIRAKRGKALPAKLLFSATRDRDTVVVAIEDDGAGLDPTRLRALAVERGLVTQTQADGLSVRDSLFLICLPGFSTKASVSDVSGRGVGMDVVRAEIERLSGTLDIESSLGEGTRFVFRVPLTLAIVNALVVEAAGRPFAVPVAKIASVREIGDDALEEAGGRRFLRFRQSLAPIHELSSLLGLREGERAAQAVVFEDARDFAAIAVDRIVGYHEVVVKPLGEPLDRLDWYSGATILGDGEPILIIDLLKLLRGSAIANAGI
ncbi:MAG: chemotaxis protein CheA [Myxococcota bacterium]